MKRNSAFNLNLVSELAPLQRGASNATTSTTDDAASNEGSVTTASLDAPDAAVVEEEETASASAAAPTNKKKKAPSSKGSSSSAASTEEESEGPAVSVRAVQVDTSVRPCVESTLVFQLLESTVGAFKQLVSNINLHPYVSEPIAGESSGVEVGQCKLISA